MGSALHPGGEEMEVKEESDLPAGGKRLIVGWCWRRMQMEMEMEIDARERRCQNLRASRASSG